MDDLSRLQGEIARLTSENVKLHAENKSHRIKRKKAVDELASVKTEHEQALAKLASNEVAPDEWRSKYEELATERRTDKHKAAFGKVAKEFKVRDDAVEDLWALSKYTPEGDEPSEDAIKGHLEPIVKAKPYLLAAESAPQAEAPAVKPLPPGPGAARPRLSDPVGPVRFVSKAERRDYMFMKAHQKEIAEGIKNGTVTLEE